MRGDGAGDVSAMKRARTAEAEIAAVVRVRIDAVAIACTIGIANEVVARDQLALQIGMFEQHSGVDDGDDHLIGTLGQVPRQRQVDVRVVPLIGIERIVGNTARAADVVRFRERRRFCRV